MTSKNTVHVTTGDRYGYGPFIDETKDVPLAGVVIVDQFGAADEVYAANPDALIVGRSEKRRQDPVDPNIMINPAGMDIWVESGVSPEDAAKRYYDAYVDIWRANPKINIWVTFNEWAAHRDWQGEFYIALMTISIENGDPWKYAIFSESSGNPPDFLQPQSLQARAWRYVRNLARGNDWAVQQMLPALRYAKLTDNYLCLHEYGNGIEGSYPYHTGRYKFLYEILREHDADPDLLITESGFVEYPGDDMFIARARYTDDLYAGNDFVKLSAMFTLGKWFQAGIPESGLMKLAEHIVAYTAPPPVPDEPEPPIVNRGKPRTDYKRTVNVVPPDDPLLNAWSWYTYRLTENENRAVSIFLEGWRRGRETTGGSYDDAFVADLTHRLGNLFDIDSSKEQDFVTFRDDWYPGAIIDFRESSDLSEPDEPEPPPPPTPEPFKLIWPTDYKVYTQRFGARPEYYKKFGLPGHEGVDIRCPNGGSVYACADGVVSEVGWRHPDHPYGYAIRIKHDHPDDYETIYAHLEDGSAYVKVGERVGAGFYIGSGDSTGNVDGAHLHLVLLKEGATARGETNFPRDIINPELFLPKIDDAPDAPPPEETHVPVALLMLAATGLHPNDPNGSFETDLRLMADAKMDGLVFTTNSDIDPDSLGILLDSHIKPDNVIIRLHMPGTDPNIAKPAKYVELHRAWIKHGLSHGVRKFQLWNEPNLDYEMFFAGKISEDQMEWPHDAERFAEVFEAVANDLLEEYGTEVQIGFPPMSPQENAGDYYLAAKGGARMADWFAVHSYFSTDGTGLYGIDSQTGGLYWQRVLNEWIEPHTPVWITEFADNGDGPDIDRARRTAAYFTKKYPKRIKGLACYISQDENWPKQEWVSNEHMVAMVRDR